MADRWQLGAHPIVTLPANRSWSEDPLRNRNWQFLDHTLQITYSLFGAYASTGDLRYRDRAAAIIADWSRDNPRVGAASGWAWNDHSTALRATVLACATLYLPREPWFEAALQLHGRTLADPAFYHVVGNHALNQMIGLLELAEVLDRPDWQTYALENLSKLAAASIDSQGVTNEQSVSYQHYNYARYTVASRRIAEMGLTAPASFSRVALMPRFLAYATLPNGEYEMIGDTDRMQAPAIPGTWAQFSATRGAVGPRPPDTVAVYSAGYLFARTGWGERRPYADEVAASLRWGPAPIIHGHADGGSVTLYGYGSRLLVDPGRYSYNYDVYRTWFVGRTAHNVVTVDGSTWRKTTPTDLLSHSRNATQVSARVRMLGHSGVSHVRGVVFSRRLGYLLVHDQLFSSTTRTYRQLWHLMPDARPYVQSWHFRTQRARGNVQVRQLITTGNTSRVVTGRTSPVQGWVAWEEARRIAAPVVEVSRRGTSARFLTLIVPAAGTPASGVSELRLTSTGYSVRIKIGSKYERVVVSGSTVTITPLN